MWNDIACFSSTDILFFKNLSKKMQNDNEYPTDKMPKYHNLHYGLSQPMTGLCDITLEKGGFW